jgi:hypothetical protein
VWLRPQVQEVLPQQGVLTPPAASNLLGFLLPSTRKNLTASSYGASNHLGTGGFSTRWRSLSIHAASASRCAAPV